MSFDFSSIDLNTILSIAIPAIVAGIGGYFVGVKNWWNSKPHEEKKDTIKDAIDALKDGKLTPDEVKSLIDEHV